MLQSSIYPESYGVPSEYFFIIKVEFETLSSLPCDVVLQKLHLEIKDKTNNKTTGKPEDIIVEINRSFVGKSDDTANEIEDGVILRRRIGKFENKILLYVENLGAVVNGYVQYRSIYSKNNDS